MLDDHDGLYWTPFKLLSYNRLINIAMGTRTAGKSFSVKWLLLNDYIKKGNQFVILKRHVTETQDPLFRSYFDDLLIEYFPEHSIKIGEKFITLDGNICGYVIPLNKPERIKGQSLSRVKWILFDEFLSESNDYLPDEIGNLLNIYQSIARGYVNGQSSVIRENCRIILLANAVSMVNPYLRFLNVYDLKKGINKGPGYAIELFTADKIKDKIEATQFGKLIKGTKYGDYALDNSFYLDNSKYIATPDKSKASYVMSIKFKGRYMSVSLCNGFAFVSRDYNPQHKSRYIIGDYEEGHVMLKYSSYECKKLREYFEADLMRFSDIEVKTEMIEILNIILYKGGDV